MSEVIITVGPSASGKSTFAKNWVRESKDRIRVNRDDLRMSLYGYGDTDLSEYYQDSEWYTREPLITDVSSGIITEALDLDLSIIVDNTNLSYKYLRKLVDFLLNFRLQGYKVDVKIKTFFENDCETCLRYDLERPEGQRVGKAVLQKQFEQVEKIKEDSRFGRIVEDLEEDYV